MLALIDMEIGHEELITILKVKDKYEKFERQFMKLKLKI